MAKITERGPSDQHAEPGQPGYMPPPGADEPDAPPAPAVHAPEEPDVADVAEEVEPDGEPGDGYDQLGNDALRGELGKRGLPTSGNKADLIARLREDDAAREAPPPS